MSEIKDDGGPAFPNRWPENEFQPAGPGNPVKRGMTLRDYFAAKALSGLLSCPDESLCDASDPEGIERERREYAEKTACDSYRYADAMLKAREA